MKKLLVLGMFLWAGTLNAATLGPEFKVWRSSTLGTNNIGMTLFSSVPVIMHMVVGSSTWNQGGNSYFSVVDSTNVLPSSLQGDLSISTKVFVSLDKDTTLGGMGIPFDILCTSYVFVNKQGGAPISIFYDYYESPPTGFVVWDKQTRILP